MPLQGRDLQDAWIRACLDMKPALLEMGQSMKQAAAALKGFTLTVSKSRQEALKPGTLVRAIECAVQNRIVSWNNYRIPVGVVGTFECYEDVDETQPIVRFGDILFNTTAIVRLGVNAEVVDIVTAIGGLEGRTET